MKLTANRIAGMLRQRGYKLTAQRRAILKVLPAAMTTLTRRRYIGR
jgi:Fe2+ or Zn2+ uptake regulation protein